MAYGNATNTPFGFRPSQYINGSTWTGQMSPYLIASGYNTSLFTGDLVTFTNDGTITRAVAGTNAVCGVFQGVQYIDANGVFQNLPYWAANTVTQGTNYATALVVDDPNVLFDVQASNTQNVAPTSATVSVIQVVGGTTSLFNNANFGLAGGGGAGITNPTGGSTITGQSAMYLDINSLGIGATQQLKIIRFTPVPGNISGVLYNNVLVSLNNHVLRGGTGTAGV